MTISHTQTVNARYWAAITCASILGTSIGRQHAMVRIGWTSAKRGRLARLDAGAAAIADDEKYLKLREIVGHDPLPCGIEENRKTVEALEQTAFKQGLTPRRMTIGELFVDPRGPQKATT